MANWIFVDLQSFVDKVDTVLKTLSVHYSCSDDLDFAMRQRASSPQIIFLNGNRGERDLKAQIRQSHKEDFIYLVVNTSSLSNEMEGEINRFLLNCNRVKGVIDGNQGMGFIISELNGIKKISDMIFELGTDKDYFEDFEQRVEEITSDISKQLEQVKQLHHSLVIPKQVQLGKLRTTCKYAAGDSTHSEFWDISRSKRHQLTFLISTESSQSLTRILDQIILFLDQEEYDQGGIQIFYQYLKKSLQEKFGIIIILTHVDSMESSFIIDGDLKIFVNGIEVDSFDKGQLNKMQLRSGDKMFIISSGMLKNYQNDFKENDLIRILQKKWQLPVFEFIHQVFLGAKINKPGRFHYNDATSMIFEVIS